MEILDFIFEIDKYLHVFIESYGYWIYAILFAIIFVETGFVVMPFLPGDSLLFAAGMLIAQSAELNIWFLIALLIVAAVSGDSLNYFIGTKVGMQITKLKVFKRQIIKDSDIEKTHSFYEKYGEKTIVIARFVPIVRTLAPFVAGVGKMSYAVFMKYNIIGGIIWITSLSLAGYYLGNIPFVKDNFSKIVLLIIIVSVLPIVYEVIKAKFKKEAID